jgi:hypothetical protein
MDHKVSKDMISSGMIPSGEKTQADLGKTQYGSAPSPSKLMDAYKSMYDKKEEVINEHHKKDADGNTIPHEGEELNEGKIPAGLQAYLDKKKGKKEDKKEVKEMIERIAGGPARNEMGKVATKSPAKLVGDAISKIKDKPKTTSYSFDKDSLSMKKKLDQRKAEVAKGKDEKREKVTNIMNKMGENADLFDIVSTYFIEEGYDKKDVYAAMSSIDLSEIEDLNEVGPLAAIGGMLGKLGIGAKAGAAAAKAGAAAGKTGAMASKVTSGAAKVTASGGKVVQGGGPTSLMGKAKKFVKDNPLTSYSIARDMTSGGGGSAAGQTKTSSISASADLFDIVKGQLLDEGLSEEEIKDIMLTLTPDEILNEISAETALAASKARDVQAGKLKGPENTEKRAELRAKASQNYDRSVEKRKAGFVKNTATPQGPSRIPTGGM